jgi:hypothetical protein
MTDLYNNPAVREHADHIVRNEVQACASFMVSQLAQNFEAARALGLEEEELFGITSRDDWEEPARDWIRSADADALADAREYMSAEGAEVSDDIEATRASLLAAVESADDWQDFCDYVREDAHTIEAYEHWIISDWLADKLEEQGEMVARDFLGFTIWGRPTTGQAISMDGVILQIADNALRA